MKYTVLILLLAAGAAGANAQAQPKATTTHCQPVSGSGPCAVKLPPGVPPGRGPVHTAFALRYLDIKIGAGAEAEPNKFCQIYYTGWLGANGRPDDGREIDSTSDHPGPQLLDKDGKVVRDDNGEVKLSDPLPMSFVQGSRSTMAGFDKGFAGMRVGGKRRVFIPWQLGYGLLAHAPIDPVRSVIPAQSDLIYDIELVSVSDTPTPPSRPGNSAQPATSLRAKSKQGPN